MRLRKIYGLLAAFALAAVVVLASAGQRVSANENAQATEDNGGQAGRYPLCPPGAKIQGTPTETPVPPQPDASKPVIFIGVVARSVAHCGARITAFRRGSPALEGGARIGDVIVAVDGAPIDSSTAFFIAVAAKNPGDTTILTVDRTVARRTAAATPDPVQGVRIAANVEELDVAVVLGQVGSAPAAAPAAPSETPESPEATPASGGVG